jgi:hypothetical protein
MALITSTIAVRRETVRPVRNVRALISPLTFLTREAREFLTFLTFLTPAKPVASQMLPAIRTTIEPGERRNDTAEFLP